ncbi:MAG: CvpA family protein [Candidatus Omnitrophota bacterium]
MNIVDGVVLGLCAVYAFFGWRKGLARTLIGPVVLFLCLYLAWGYWQRGGDWRLVMTISVLGPLVLTFLLGMMLTLLSQGENGEEQKMMSPLNRTLGALTNTAWNGALVIAAVVFFALIPLRFESLLSFRETVRESLIFQAVGRPIEKRFPQISRLGDPSRMSAEDFQDVQKTDEFQQLMNDERLQQLFQDPVIQEKLRSRDVAGLIEDQRIKEIIQDRALLKKMWSFQKRLMQQTDTGSK